MVFAHTNLLLDKNLFDGFLIIGWSGVDFFFILSGFIIYYVNHKYDGISSKFQDYIGKRLARIYPIYWIYSILVVVLHMALLKAEVKNLISWLGLTALNITKSFTLYPTDIKNNIMPIIPAAWTLTYEMFFYIVFSIYILGSKRLFLISMILWAIAISIVNLFSFTFEISPFLSMLFDTHIFEFMFGCFIAQITLRNLQIKTRKNAIVLLVVGIVALFVSWINEALGLIWFDKLQFITFGIPYSIIIYSLISLEDGRIHSNLKRFLLYLGDASYSIYLTHFVVLVLFVHIASYLNFNGYIEFAIISIALVLIGCLSYSYIEFPLTKFIQKKMKLKKTHQQLH